MKTRRQMTKRERKALDRQARVSWSVQPVTRVKPSGKRYQRSKIRVPDLRDADSFWGRDKASRAGRDAQGDRSR